MYSKDKDGKKDRKADVNRLWKSLHGDDEQFSDSIECLARKANESDMHRKFEIMFSVYLDVMIRMDNRVFLSCAYWDITPQRIYRVYRLLVRHGYAERIIALALGAADLYERTRHKEYNSRAAELRELARWYESRLEQHQRLCFDGDVERKDCWSLIRASNRAFTIILGTVRDGSVGGKAEIGSYFYCLEGLTDDERLNALYIDSMIRLINPRAYKWKRFLDKHKPMKKPKRNKEKIKERKMAEAEEKRRGKRSHSARRGKK